MPFLTATDYDTYINPDILAQVIGPDDTTLRPAAEQAAQAQIESHLRSRFDVATAFATTEADRNPELVMYMVDMSLYHLHSRVNPKSVPELRAQRYDDALSWLKRVSRGELTPALPELPDEQQSTGFAAYYNPRRSHSY